MRSTERRVHWLTLSPCFFEVAVPAVINVEEEFGGTGDMHGVEHKAELRPCKASERRSRDARPVRALSSSKQKSG